MRIKLTIPKGEVDERTLNAALEAATVVSERQAAHLPPIKKAIREHGVRWRPEPPGDEHFDLPATVFRRGWGDCDDLAPWRAAELRAHGVDPNARAVAVRSGPARWHALVVRGSGAIEDPSVWAGMRRFKSQGAPVERPIVGGVPYTSPAMRLQRLPSVYIARVDAPCVDSPYGMSLRRTGAHPIQAMGRALRSAAIIGEVYGTIDPRCLTLYAALEQCLRGRPIHKVCGALGVDEDIVGRHLGPLVVSAGLREEVGFPCLAALGPIITAATTAGTIAAAAGPIAEGLRKLVGENTDFGRAMATVSQVMNYVKIPSAVAAGLGGLIASGIPGAWTHGVSRWAELLQSPLAAAGQSGNVPEVAKGLATVERAAAKVVPPQIATLVTPKVFELLAKAAKGDKGAVEDAFNLVKDKYHDYLDKIHAPGDLDKLAKAAANKVMHEVTHAEPPPGMGQRPGVPPAPLPHVSATAASRAVHRASRVAAREVYDARRQGRPPDFTDIELFARGEIFR